MNEAEVLHLFKFCTKSNTFKFGDFYYKQINGVAMGSPLTPALSEVFLRNFENKFINIPLNPFQILFYYRFLDDIFVVLPQDIDENLPLNNFNNIYKL